MSRARGLLFDDETGEVIIYHIDEETGEPLVKRSQVSPCESNRNSSNGTSTSKTPKYSKFPKGFATKSRKFKSLKANIIAGSNPVSYRMLLIPTVLMIFPGFICICLSLLELILHVHCHRKNKALKDPKLYYRSPFHPLTSIFCGVCREQETALRVGQLQDQRRCRYDYLRGIVV